MANYHVGDKITIEGRKFIIDSVFVDLEEVTATLKSCVSYVEEPGVDGDTLINTIKKYSEVPTTPIMNKGENTYKSFHYVNPHMHVMSSVDTAGWSSLSSNSENTDERSFAESEIKSAVEHIVSCYEDGDYLSFAYDLAATDLAADVISRLKG